MTVDERIKIIEDKIERLAGKCSPVESIMASISEHLVEICKLQQKQIEALQQANSKLDRRTSGMQLVGGYFPNSRSTTEQEQKAVSDTLEKSMKDKPTRPYRK